MARRALEGLLQLLHCIEFYAPFQDKEAVGSVKTNGEDISHTHTHDISSLH